MLWLWYNFAMKYGSSFLHYSKININGKIVMTVDEVFVQYSFYYTSSVVKTRIAYLLNIMK